MTFVWITYWKILYELLSLQYFDTPAKNDTTVTTQLVSSGDPKNNIRQNLHLLIFSEISSFDTFLMKYIILYTYTYVVFHCYVKHILNILPENSFNITKLFQKNQSTHTGQKVPNLLIAIIPILSCQWYKASRKKILPEDVNWFDLKAIIRNHTFCYCSLFNIFLKRHREHKN